MSNPIKIIVQLDAQSKEASQKIVDFFAQLDTGVNKQLKQLPQATHESDEGLKKLKETATVSKEAFHTLQGSVLLLGGSHFPVLAEAVNTARTAMMGVRSAAVLTGVSLSTMVPVLAGIGFALGAGIMLWKDWTGQSERAEERTRRLGEALRQLPGAIGAIKTLVGTKLLPDAEANKLLERMGAVAPAQGQQAPLMRGGMVPLSYAPAGTVIPNGLDDVRAELVKKGFLLKTGDEKNPQYEVSPQIEALQRLQEMQKQVAAEGVGFNKERLEALTMYKEMIEQAEKYAALAGKFFSAEDLASVKEGLRQNFNWSQARIGFKQDQEKEKQAAEAFNERKSELARQAKEQQEKLEHEITATQLEEGQKRGQDFDEEYNKRFRLAQELYYSGLIEEKDYTELVLQASIKRLDARQREAERAVQLLDMQNQNQSRQLQLQQDLIANNPYKTQVEKARELLPLLREQYELITKTQIPAIDRQMQAPGITEMDRARLTGQRTDLQARAGSIGTQIQQAGDVSSFSGRFSGVMTNLQNDWGSWAMQAANAFASVFNTAISSISSGITGLIMGTKTWGQALMEIGRSMLTGVVEACAQMVVRWAMTHVVMAAISRVFRVGETAETVAHTTAQVGIHEAGEEAKSASTAGHVILRGLSRIGETIFHAVQVALRVGAHIAGEVVMTAVTIAQSAVRIGRMLVEALVWLIKTAFEGASAVASIPYVGPILAIAAMAGIMAAGIGYLSGAFEKGGRPEVGKVALVGEGGPELFIPDQAGTIIPADKTQAMLEGMHQSSSSKAANGGSQRKQLDVALYMTDQRRAEDLRRDPGFEGLVLDVLDRNIHKYR